MAITPASLTDAEELVALINAAYRGENSKKGWTTEAHLIDGQRIGIPELTEQMTDPSAVILKNTDDNGKITGCVYLQKRGEKLYLGMLTVSPLLQAKGLGRQLIAAAEDHARSIGLHIITMTVITTRTELLEWYYRRGFKRLDEIIPLVISEKFGVLKQPVDMYRLEKSV